MANISRKNNKLNISSKDLKKAIIEKNNSLKRQNDKISLIVKDKEKGLKSLEKQYAGESKRLGQLLKDIGFQEERLQKLNGGVYSNEKLLEEKLKKVGKAEEEFCNYKSAAEELEGKERKLLDKIAGLEFYKSKCVDSKNELAGIQIKKDNAFDELGNIKADIEQLYVDHNSKVLSFEDEYSALEEKAKSHEDMVHQFEQRLIETQDLFKEEENKLKDFISKSKKEKETAGQELQAVQNLCNDSEDKYIKWEQKVAKAKDKADKEEERIVSAKERFSKWKIGILEEVAKLKLKSKVDKIDKAGLSDILNG